MYEEFFKEDTASAKHAFRTVCTLPTAETVHTVSTKRET